MRFKRIIRMFEDGNVCVYGLRGCGKDMLMSNVAVRRKSPYLSNVDYGGMYMPLDLETLDCGKNTYVDFINGKVKHYTFPYCDGTDVYISDAGVYFPSQHQGELVKKYPYFATTQALSRHIGQFNIHCNSQSLSRIWDKIREQCDTYILCRKCFVLFKGKLVIQLIRTYDLYDSAVNKVPPFKCSAPLFNKEARATIKTSKQLHESTHGIIKNCILIYRNKSTYNTRFFKELLAGGEYVLEDKKRF